MLEWKVKFLKKKKKKIGREMKHHNNKTQLLKSETYKTKSFHLYVDGKFYTGIGSTVKLNINKKYKNKI